MYLKSDNWLVLLTKFFTVLNLAFSGSKIDATR